MTTINAGPAANPASSVAYMDFVPKMRSGPRVPQRMAEFWKTVMVLHRKRYGACGVQTPSKDI